MNYIVFLKYVHMYIYLISIFLHYLTPYNVIYHILLTLIIHKN